MYIFAIFIVAAITCISQPKKTTLRDKAMVNYAFDYLSSPGSLPFTTAATELSAIHGHSTSQYRLGEFYLHEFLPQWRLVRLKLVKIFLSMKLLCGRSNAE